MSGSKVKVEQFKSKTRWKASMENTVKNELKAHVASDPMNLEALKKLGLLHVKQADYTKVYEDHLLLLSLFLLPKPNNLIFTFTGSRYSHSADSQRIRRSRCLASIRDL